MSSSRIYGVPVDWRLPQDREPWKFETRSYLFGVDDRPRSLAAVEAPAVADIPAAPFVPGPPPAPLKPIGDGIVIRGTAVPWNQRTEINSRQEGHFFEQFQKGAFSRSLAAPNVKLAGLFQHGQDASVGYKPLGPIAAWESDRGLEFELSVLDVPYAQEIAAGVQAGVYGGASVRFATVRDNVRRNPGRSAANPRGIEERTIQEAALREVSIVLWPAYSGTSVAA